MSLPWPRIGVLALSAVIVGGLAIHIEQNRPDYGESATVLFTMPAANSSTTGYTWQAEALISTGSVISQIVMSPQIEHKVAQAGGTAAYSLTLVNLYNQDYPDFGYPEATLSVHSANPVSTHRTYLIAKRTLIETLASQQKQAGAPRGDRIVVQVADDSGPIPRTGSPKRALGGLLLLGLVAGGTGWSLTGRRRRLAAS
jgi:hypothetical protein